MLYRIAKAYPDTMLMIPEAVLDKIEQAGEGEVKILLCAAAYLKRSPLEEEDLVNALSPRFSREEIISALAFWRGCGILKGESLKKSSPKKKVSPDEGGAESSKAFVSSTPAPLDADEAPFYSSHDLAKAAEANPDFKNLVSFAEGRLEKVMNAGELARLYSFLDYLKMPLDVVMLVIEDCVSRDKRSLRYITKMLTSFQDDGIDNYEKAEAYFAARQEKNLYEKHVRSLFGLGDRKLTAAEEEILSLWRSRYGYGEEMLNAAYEKTVASAKTPSIKYMHKILESWFTAGIRSVEEIEKASGANRGEKAPKSYDLDDFFEQAVSKGRKKL